MIGDVLTLFYQDEVEHYRIDKINDETLELTGLHGRAVLAHKKGLLDSLNGKKITGFVVTPAPTPFIVGSQVRVEMDDLTFEGQVVQCENHVLELVHHDERFYLDLDDLPKEVVSVSPIEIQAVDISSEDAGTPSEMPLLEHQLRCLYRAILPHDATIREEKEVSRIVDSYRKLHETFTNSAFEPTPMPPAVEMLQKSLPPWVVPVIDPYKRLHRELTTECDAHYQDPSKTKGRYTAYKRTLADMFLAFESCGEKLSNRVEAAAFVDGRAIHQVVVDEPVNFKQFLQLPCTFAASSIYRRVTMESATLGFYECKRQWLNHALPLDVDVDALLESCTALSFADVVAELEPYGVRWWNITPQERTRINDGVRKRVGRLKISEREAQPSTSLPKADILYSLPPMLSSERLAARLEMDGMKAHLKNCELKKPPVVKRDVVAPVEAAAESNVLDVVTAIHGADSADVLSILMRYGRDAVKDEDPTWCYFRDEDARLAPSCLFEICTAEMEGGKEGYEMAKRRVPVFEVDGLRIHQSGAILDSMDFKDELQLPEKKPFQWKWLTDKLDVEIPEKEWWRAKDLVSATALAIVFGANKTEAIGALREKEVMEAVYELHFLEQPESEKMHYTGSCSLENIRNKEAKRWDCAAQAIPMIRAILGKETKTTVRKMVLSSSTLVARLKAANALKPHRSLQIRQLNRKTEDSKNVPLNMEVEDEPMDALTTTFPFEAWGITTNGQIDGGKLGNKVKQVTASVAECLKRKPSLDLVSDLIGEWKGACRLSDLVAAHVVSSSVVLPRLAMLGRPSGRLVTTTAPANDVGLLTDVVKNYYDPLTLPFSEIVRSVYGSRARNETAEIWGDSPVEVFARYYDENKEEWKAIKNALEIAGEWRASVLKYSLLYSWSLLCNGGDYGVEIMKTAVEIFVRDAARL